MFRRCVASDAGPSTRAPQCGQNGSVESTGLPTDSGTHSSTPPFGAPAVTRGYPVFPSGGGPTWNRSGAWRGAADGRRPAGTGMTRAPPLAIGLPQSMQKADCSSLSRPQKPQRFTRSSPMACGGSMQDGHFSPSAANIGRGSGSGQSHASIWLSIMRPGPLSPSLRARISGRLFAGAGARTGAGAGSPAPAGAPVVSGARAARRRPSVRAVPAGLPPIPRVDGPLDLRVVYPAPSQLLTVRDSNYIFGSTGSGAARLTIDGLDVPVLRTVRFSPGCPVPDGRRSTIRTARHARRRGARARRCRSRFGRRPPPLPDTGRLRGGSRQRGALGHDRTSRRRARAGVAAGACERERRAAA